METITDIENPTKVSRKSPGIFGYINLFQSTIFVLILLIGLAPGIGIATMFIHWIQFPLLPLDWWLMLRITFLFYMIIISGTIACHFFLDHTPLFTWRLAFLMNSFGATFFGLSYVLGIILDYLVDGSQFSEIFFIMGALIAYIVLFVVYFSFTNVGPPWYIFLALIQPVVGIIIYSFYSEQVTIVFFTKAIIFFLICAAIFAITYGPAMATVSFPYRKKTGIGGYNFVRAFVEALLLEDHDAGVERYFESFSESRGLELQYIAFREVGSETIKGLFVVPNVHFGPFKTAGSAALAERIYTTFKEIPGMTVFHTTTTHGENFATQQSNSHVISQIKEDLAKLEFKPPEFPKFFRVFEEKTKILGTMFNSTPFLMFTRHPYPTDDVDPKVGQKIREKAKALGFPDPILVDCHNCLIGDEILVTPDSEIANEIISTADKFLNRLKTDSKICQSPILYGVARDSVKNIPISSGIGGGGIIVHLFKIGVQETLLIHIDANNATPDVRSALISLAENKAVDRVEISTSDTHAVVRIISSQGYYPLGTKISTGVLMGRIGKLIGDARENLAPVEIATHNTRVDGYRFWKNISYFDLIIDTIEKSLSVSKILLTIGLVFPTFIAIILMLFFY